MLASDISRSRGLHIGMGPKCDRMLKIWVRLLNTCKRLYLTPSECFSSWTYQGVFVGEFQGGHISKSRHHRYFRLLF